MTKEQIMSLIRRRIDKCQESINTTDDYAYYVGMQRGLLQAQELIGMLDKPNKSTQGDGPSQPNRKCANS